VALRGVRHDCQHARRRVLGRRPTVLKICSAPSCAGFARRRASRGRRWVPHSRLRVQDQPAGAWPGVVQGARRLRPASTVLRGAPRVQVEQVGDVALLNDTRPSSSRLILDPEARMWYPASSRETPASREAGATGAEQDLQYRRVATEDPPPGVLTVMANPLRATTGRCSPLTCTSSPPKRSDARAFARASALARAMTCA